MKKRILTLCHENKIDAAIALLADLIQKNNAALACDLACLKKEWQSFQTALYLNLYTPQQVKGLIIEDVERILKKLSTTVEMPPPENKPHVQKETNTACKNT